MRSLIDSDFFQFHADLFLAFVLSLALYSGFLYAVIGSIYERLKEQEKEKKAQIVLKSGLIGYAYVFAIFFWMYASGKL